MSNIFGVSDIPFLSERIDALLKRIRTGVQIGILQTRESLGEAFSYTIERLNSPLENLLYEIPRIRIGSFPDLNVLNTILSLSLSEVTYLFGMLMKTAEVSESNFNIAIAEANRLRDILTDCRKQLSIVGLYLLNTTKLFLPESFLSRSNYDFGSSFLSGDECWLNSDEGTLTLPLVEDPSSYKIDSVMISGNGVLGSNIEEATPVRGNSSFMFDGNADSWTEFERVVFEEDGRSLFLDLQFKLSSVSIVNAIKCSFVLLGGRTSPRIEHISTSVDGSLWKGVDGEISTIPEVESGSDRYKLSLNSTLGTIFSTFSPRSTLFIRLRIHQDTGFSIEDVYNSPRVRYAIGIRELEIYGLKFKGKGEFVSNNLSLLTPVQALALTDVIDPISLSPAFNVRYALSGDNGSSWQPIISQEETSPEIREVAWFDSPIESLRWKTFFERDDEALLSLLSSREGDRVEENLTLGDTFPRSFTLSSSPIESSLSVVSSGFAVRGRGSPRFIIGKGVPNGILGISDPWRRTGATELRIPIPLQNIINLSEIMIMVGSEIFEKRFSTSDFSNNPFARQCCLHRSDITGESSETTTWEVVFGNGVSFGGNGPRGRIPLPGEIISIVFSAETILLEGINEPYNITLDYPSDGVKANTQIRFLSSGKVFSQATGVRIPSGITYRQLPRQNLYNDTIDGVNRYIKIYIQNMETGDRYYVSKLGGAAGTPFATWVDFVNGDTELGTSGSGCWTIDERLGRLYLRDPIDSNLNVSISYFYGEYRVLDDSDWDFVPGTTKKINIYESGRGTIENSVIISSTSVSSVDLGVKGIVPKSVRILSDNFSSFFGIGKFPYEVPFIDGISEFSGINSITGEYIPSIRTISSIFDILSFKVSHNPNTYQFSSFGVQDEHNIFQNEVDTFPEVLLAIGNYAFARQGSDIGTVWVHLPSSSIPIGLEDVTYSYQYKDPIIYNLSLGAYSVDARNGLVHFMGPNEETGTISFQYSPYEIAYNLAQPLKPSDYTLSQRLLTILRSPGSHSSLNVSYTARPSSEEASEMVQYCSPLLRGFIIKGQDI